MLDVISVLFKRVFAYLLSLLALLNLIPNKPAQPGDPGDKPYAFASAQAYQDYYFYCTEEDPEPYAWSPEALAARENVDRTCAADGFAVTLFKNGTARIDALTSPMRDVTIPAEVEGRPVTAIFGILPRNDYDTAGRIADAVKTVTIPDSVEYIMEGAFEDLSNLRSVQFGSRVKYMEANAFRDCVYLTGVILPDHPDAGIGPGQLQAKLPGAVGGAVVHQDQLPVGKGLSLHALHAAGQEVLYIIDRHDDGNSAHESSPVTSRYSLVSRRHTASGEKLSRQ